MAGGSESDRQELERLRTTLAAAENAFDPERISAAMAEDVVIMPQFGPSIEGAGACRAFVREVLTSVNSEFQRPEPMRYRSAEVIISGDIAIDRGEFSQTLQPRAGGAAVHEVGKYLWVLVRQNGSWKVSRLIFNMHEVGPEHETA